MNQQHQALWAHHLGIVTGSLLALNAPQQAIDAASWMIRELTELAPPQPKPSKPAATQVKEVRQHAQKTEPRRARRLWTGEEERHIAQLYNEGKNIASIADRYPSRNYKSIYSLITRLKAEGKVRPAHA